MDTFLIAVTNTSQRQLKEERVDLGLHSIVVGKVQWQELEVLVTLYPQCDVGSREMNGGAQLVCSFLFSLGPMPKS